MGRGSNFARAQLLPPGMLCHFLVEGTDVHMVLVVDNPHSVQGFIGRFKTESSGFIPGPGLLSLNLMAKNFPAFSPGREKLCFSRIE